MTSITKARFMDGLVLWLPMVEGAGIRVNDQSLYRNNGIFGAGAAAPSWVVGRDELPGVEFDGDDDYVSIEDAPSLDITGAITIIMRAKPLTIDFGETNLRGYLVSKSHGGGYIEGGFELVKEPNNKIYFSKTNGLVGTGNGVLNWNWDSIPTLTTSWVADREYHIAASWDGTLNNNGMKMYVDSVLETQATASQDVILANNHNIYIATLRNTHYWTHSIYDDFRLYNRALDPYEIRADFEAVRKI